MEIRVFRRRYIMLVLFSATSAMNAFPQFLYTVVADVLACYYDVSVGAIEWTALIYMVVFLPLVLPIACLIQSRGIRPILLVGGFLNALGSWLQCFSLTRNSFAILMASQTAYALGQVPVLSLPPILAARWFGQDEVGLACAVGVFGNQLGIALGFIVPPLVIGNECIDSIAIGLGMLAYACAGINTLLMLGLLVVFQERPPVYPSLAQAKKEGVDEDYVQSLKNLLTHKQFIKLLVAYGFITGVYFAISTILNEMILLHFPGDEETAGWVGAILVMAGLIGSIIFGFILDRTHRFKEVSVMAFTTSLFLMATYTGLASFEIKWIPYILFTLLGFTMTGYLPVGFDFGAEITYPESEAMSASLLNTSTQIFSIALTLASSPLLQFFGDMASNLFFCSCLLAGTFFIVFIRCDLKRTEAGEIGS